MLIITLQVNAPDGSAQAVKETLAMYLERFGDTKVISIEERLPTQMTMGNMSQEETRYNKNRR